MPKYLQKRHRTWYAVMEIPKSLRPKFKRPRFFKSLKTDSQAAAEIRVLPIVAEWKKAIALARNNSPQFNSVLADIRRLNLEPHHAADLAFDAVLNEYEDTGDVSDETFEASEVLSGGRVLLSEHIDTYLATQIHLEQKSQDMKRSDLVRFTKKFRFADEVSQLSLIDWTENELFSEEGLTGKTCSRILSSCRGYWLYLQRHQGLKISTPFSDVIQRRSGPLSGSRRSRQPFTANHFRTLLKACPAPDRQLQSLIILGAHTGARIEELCSLETANIDEDCFNILDSKTDAGIRKIPIHSAINEHVEILLKKTNDGFLISGLSKNKYGNRSNAVGKRFGRLKRLVGFGSEYVFHSFRKGVATQFEQNGIPENEASRLLGHELNTMTYGLYSGGNIPVERLKTVIETLKWF